MGRSRSLRRLVWLAVGLLAGCMNPDLLDQVRHKNQATPSAAMAALPPEEDAADMTRVLQQSLAGVDDSARIVYAAMIAGKAEIFSLLPDGTRSIQLTSDQRYKCRPAWSPDHRHIAFFRYPSDRPVSDVASLIIMDVNGANQRVVIPRLKIDLDTARISWRPDGSRVYVQEKDFGSVLFGYDVSSGKPVETVRIPKTSFLTLAYSLSPDLQTIAGAGPDPKTGALHIGTVRRDGSLDTDLMKPFRTVAYHVGTVVWSYDGQLVAYELDNLVIVMSSYYRPGFKANPITPNEPAGKITGAAFSPTGKFIAYTQEITREAVMGAGERETVSDLWVVDADGTHARPITREGSCFDPHW